LRFDTLLLAADGNVSGGSRSRWDFTIETSPGIRATALEGGNTSGVILSGDANSLVTSTRATRNGAHGKTIHVRSGKVSLGAQSALAELILTVLRVAATVESGDRAVGSGDDDDNANGIGIVEGSTTALSALVKAVVIAGGDCAVLLDGGGRLLADRAGVASDRVIHKTSEATASVTDDTTDLDSLASSMVAFTTAFLVDGYAAGSLRTVTLLTGTALSTVGIKVIGGGGSVLIARSADFAQITGKVGRAMANSNGGDS